MLLLDAVGIEIFIALLGLPFTTFVSMAVKPLFYQAWRWLVPFFRALHQLTTSVYLFRFVRDLASYALFNWVDNIGPEAWRRLHRCFRAARLGPRSSFKPDPLRGAA